MELGFHFYEYARSPACGSGLTAALSDNPGNIVGSRNIAFHKMTADIRIGTSGYHYKHWVGTFYPPKTPASKMLGYHVRYFDTLELNNSFYRLPTIAAFESWRDATPKNFVFAVKASRYITHNKKLKDPENALDNILARAEHLGKKLGPVLFQLPPHWKLNIGRLEALLEILPRQHRYVFEFRELSWITAEVNKLLRRFNAAFCIYELAGYHTPIEVTADFTYVRLHGPGSGKYQGSYSPARLREWARRIEQWSKELKAIYVYFDNDQAGYAAQNALTLKQMVLGGSVKFKPTAA
ncbi:MAG: DUF72 domain-containing protein [Candidatus Angelobacter sp.]